jgi:hypothetical protein
MVVEQGLAGVRDAYDVRDGPVSESGNGSTVDQPLSLEGCEIRARSSAVVDLSPQVIGEHRSVTANALKQIYFRSAQVIQPALVTNGLARRSKRQRERVLARRPVPITRTKCPPLGERLDAWLFVVSRRRLARVVPFRGFS